jgi:hypothetical protein
MIVTTKIAKEMIVKDQGLFIDWIEDVNDEDLVCEISGETDVSLLCHLKQKTEDSIGLCG